MQKEHRMREIEQKLSLFPSRIVEHSVLVKILEDLGYQNPNAKIIGLKEEGILTALKRGYYVYNPLQTSMISKESIANVLLGPSYVSLDYALYFYDLIPEAIHRVSSVTTKRSKSFQTPYGLFAYQQIPKALFNLALEIHPCSWGNFLIASKEKALCDKVFLTRGAELRSREAMLVFLEEDLRMDLDALSLMRVEVFEEFFQKSKSKKIKILKKLIEEFSSD